MKNFIAGQDIVIDVLFEENLDTVVPDTGSIKYDLYDNGGSKVASAIAVSDNATSVVPVTILAALNAKTGTFALRTLVVNWKKDGGQRSTSVPYRLIDFVPLGVDANSVRSLVGLARNELPDEDIDLYSAYISTKEDAGSTLVDDALAAGTSVTLAVNRAIAARAMIDVLGSIELRAMQEDKSNTAQMSRFSKIDFAALRAWLQGLYDKALGILDPIDVSTFGSGITLITTLPTKDAITGADPVIPGSE